MAKKKKKNDRPEAEQPDKDPELRAIYDKIRREFSAADLQKYTVIEPLIPAEQVLAEMEEIQRKLSAKHKGK